MKFNPFCMCCAVGKQEQNIRSFQDMDKKVEYMKKVMDRMANIAEEDCAPSVSVELKKMFRDFWEQPVEDYTSVKKEYNRLMLDMEASLEERPSGILKIRWKLHFFMPVLATILILQLCQM